MKILLLQPPICDFYDTEVRLQPTGLCSLKAAVGRHLPGVDVEVRDYHHGWGRRTVPLPPELGDLRAFYPCPDRSPFSTFHDYYHFGAPYEALADDVASARPDLVGISASFSAYHREALACAEAIQARLQVPIVVGGAHASAAPASVLRHPAVDFVIRGEGERPLVELVCALLEGRDFAKVPNLAFREGGRIVLNSLAPNFSLEEIPAPDFRDLAVDRYRLGRQPLVTVLTSRGCPQRCNFCSVHTTFRDGYRRRPVTAVVAEIRSRHAEKYRVFDFEDDGLAAGGDDLKALCRSLMREFPGMDLNLQAMNGIHYRFLDAELLGLMREAGFTHLNLSLVSGDEAVCRGVGRASSTASFRGLVAEAHRLGFRIVAYQIIGLPGEALPSVLDTLALLARLPVLIGTSPFYLPPGSPLAEQIGGQTEGAMVRCRLTAMGHEQGGIPREAVYTLFVTARIVNFLKGIEVPREEVSLVEALEGASGAGLRSRIGVELLTRLLDEGVLYADTGRGLRPLPKFRSELFRQAWGRLGSVTTRVGSRIDLDPLPTP
jgi:radical SAM superfamily enzyme YgiQ (UPF0313 family)